MSYNEAQNLKNAIRARMMQTVGLAQPYGQAGQNGGLARSYGQPSPYGQAGQRQGRLQAGAMLQNGNRQFVQQPVRQQSVGAKPMPQGNGSARGAAQRQAPHSTGTLPQTPPNSGGRNRQGAGMQNRQGAGSRQAGQQPMPQVRPVQPAYPMQAGAYFDKYDCGHDYPKMTVGQHIKQDLQSGSRERGQTLQYAFVMSEVLGKPVSRKRRHR